MFDVEDWELDRIGGGGALLFWWWLYYTSG